MFRGVALGTLGAICTGMRSMKLVLVACLLGAGIATACASQGEEAQVAVQDHERVLLQRDGYAATLSMVRDQPDTLVVTGRGIRATFRVHRSGNVALASTSAGGVERMRWVRFM